jgi:hypothetical protein
MDLRDRTFLSSVAVFVVLSAPGEPWLSFGPFFRGKHRRQGLHSLQEADERDCRTGGAD